LTEEQKRTTVLLAVSVDDHEKQQMMIDRISMEDGILPDYPLLSDPDHRVIDRYGLFNPDESRRRPVPHPTTFVIDQRGVVQWKFVEINYRIRPELDDILAAVSALEDR
jgi:peroxiredoxin